MKYIFFLLICLAAYISYRKKWLTISGSLLSVIVGSLIMFGVGLKGIVILGAFFVSSSLVSQRRKRIANYYGIEQKSSQRDGVQVLANGGVAALLSTLYMTYPTEALWFGIIGDFSCATSDTWASEIGPLSSKRPISIRTMKSVTPGTSGAISVLGTIAALVGSAFIVTISFFLDRNISFLDLLILSMIGFFGQWIDTILGALKQRKLKCTKCGQLTEQKVHCEMKTVHQSGWYWLQNDAVNFIAISFSAILAVLYFEIR
ncbi:DUF92 domain-containing protein [Bacillaceae bacterium S4-13-56]